MTGPNVPGDGEEAAVPPENSTTGAADSDESRQVDHMSGDQHSDSSGQSIHINIEFHSQRERSTWWTRLRRRGVVVAGAVIIGAVVTVLEFLGWNPWS